MGKEREILEKVRDHIEEIGKKYAIEKAIIFGSIVRNEFKKDSDIDIIVVSDRFKGMSALKRPIDLYLEWNLNYPVDFICYTSEEFEMLKNRVSLVSEAIKEGVEIDVLSDSN